MSAKANKIDHRRAAAERHNASVTPKQKGANYTLESLLEATPEEAVALDDEDRAWLDDAAVGEELG